MKALIIVIAISYSVPSFAWFWSKDEWTGLVYPDKNNLFSHKVHGVYEDVNRCLQEGMRLAGNSGSYECGLNCDTNKNPMVCDKTIGNEK